ncbi:hypothetical protein [Natronospira bacteriovora]|uniref:Uncharacterized protein n=1 Tax=Natronospira bacteriovora TaxID=3069753 RepID=A0ABU0W8X0_9GAMM|nr:hypothetical protein [Natronospira sp. AB-CW4]MDQ2070473.1 hypothetical protein [Natronospira sp. AB-CW4]
MDASRLHGQSIQLFRLTETDTTPEVMQLMDKATVRITRLAPATTVALALPHAEWQAGHYELRVIGDPAHGVSGRHGDALDGDGDGMAGGNYSAFFELR